ncbi:predicted protein [Sparassis crispa]|uniref:Uncharacterized protein n=1 Tax=Sparassis crispa TaxID=139825 RepID=A0A401GZK3_9APHY|nr:predicted protein [Sparassis crispa]GBE87582.1 predicted protein [Sparassis crispa]
MFLFEKQTYPPYGFFILNRMGTDDYIRPIHPEDDMEIMGDYVMYRFYPEYTKKRLELGLPYPIPEEHRARFDEELARSQPVGESDAANDATPKGKKGNSVTIGLWMFATDAREPLKDVMMRLHSYIKQGKPYPQEFRFGPSRPPPTNLHVRTASRSSARSTSQASQTSDKPTRNEQVNGASLTAPTPPIGSAGSELDKLFAKLIPSASSTPAIERQAAPPRPTSGLSVHDLFARLGGSTQSPVRTPIAPAPATAPQKRGQALLDSIFASATQAGAAMPPVSLAADPHSPSNFHPVPSVSLPPRAEEIQIVSPKPTSSALPQILNHDVIYTLLGLSPTSRASSATVSSAESHTSAPNRYEGDNEEEESEPEPASETSSSGAPTPPVEEPTPPASNHTQAGRTPRKVEGDVTPRAAVRGIGPLSPAPPSQVSPAPARGQQYLTPSAASPATNSLTPDSSSVSISTIAASNSAPRQRKLVPFEAESDLWPYPRAPLDDRLHEDFDADVVELDFADTRALSDPSLFSSRLKEKQGKAGAKKKTRKERAADREREREEIEKGWDVPVSCQPQVDATVPRQRAVPAVNGKAKAKQVAANGTSAAAAAPPFVNGGGLQNGVHAAAAKDAVISAVAAEEKNIAGNLSRNDFVRELLTLIHTDKNFVDSLWQEYLNRTS